MGIVALIVTMTLLAFSFFRFQNKLLNPATFFLALWSFILFLSNLNLYGLYKPSNQAYSLLLLMIISFFIGSYIGNRFNIQKKKIIERTIKPRNYIFKILIAFLILFTLIDCAIVFQNLLKGVPMSEMRRWRMGTFGIADNPILSRRSFIEEIFRSAILSPFENILPPIAAYTFFHPKKYKKRHLILFLSICVLLLSSFAGGGGRLGFIYYFGCFILAYFSLSKKEGFERKKYRKYIYGCMLIGLIIVILYTQFRTGSGNFFKQTYIYFALPPTLLSVWLPKISEIGPLYGMLTFFGIHSYFFRGLNTLGLDFLVPNIYNEAFQHILNADIFLQVGSGVSNAFVTPIYYFFIDGGYIYICLASVLFGYLSSKKFKNYMNDINLRSFTIYALIMYGIFLSFMRIQTAIPSYIIGFIMTYLLFPTSKKEG